MKTAQRDRPTVNDLNIRYRYRSAHPRRWQYTVNGHDPIDVRLCPSYILRTEIGVVLHILRVPGSYAGTARREWGQLQREALIAASASSMARPTAERRSAPSGSTTIRLCVPRVSAMAGHRSCISVPNVKHR